MKNILNKIWEGHTLFYDPAQKVWTLACYGTALGLGFFVWTRYSREGLGLLAALTAVELVISCFLLGACWGVTVADRELDVQRQKAILDLCTAGAGVASFLVLSAISSLPCAWSTVLSFFGSVGIWVYLFVLRKRTGSE